MGGTIHASLITKKEKATIIITITCSCKKIVYEGELDKLNSYKTQCTECEKIEIEKRLKEEQENIKLAEKGCKNCEHPLIIINKKILHDGFYTQSINCETGNIHCKCQKPELTK